MFGESVSIFKNVIFLLEFGILFNLLINFISRKTDSKHIKALTNSVIFISFIFSVMFLVDFNNHFNLLKFEFFPLGILFVLYLYNHNELTRFHKIAEIISFSKNQFITLVLSFLILCIVIVPIFEFHFDSIRWLFIIIPLHISIEIAFSTEQFISIKNNKVEDSNKVFNKKIFFEYLLIILIVCLLIIALGNSKSDTFFGLISLSFFIINYAHFKQFIFQNKLELEVLSNIKTKNTQLNTKGFPYYLTPKELEVSYLILLDLKYNEIAEVMDISTKTVSKHASNIFKKSECLNLTDYIDKFGDEFGKISSFLMQGGNGYISTK